MLKIYLSVIAICVPCLGHAEKQTELGQTPHRLNLELRSTNTCNQKTMLAIVDQPKSPVFLRSECSPETASTNLDDNLVVANEITTWLRLRGGNDHDTRMIGLGFRFKVAGDGVAHIRIRNSGGLQFRYRTTF